MKYFHKTNHLYLWNISLWMCLKNEWKCTHKDFSGVSLPFFSWEIDLKITSDRNKVDNLVLLDEMVFLIYIISFFYSSGRVCFFLQNNSMSLAALYMPSSLMILYSIPEVILISFFLLVLTYYVWYPPIITV